MFGVNSAARAVNTPHTSSLCGPAAGQLTESCSQNNFFSKVKLKKKRRKNMVIQKPVCLPYLKPPAWSLLDCVCVINAQSGLQTWCFSFSYIIIVSLRLAAVNGLDGCLGIQAHTRTHSVQFENSRGQELRFLCVTHMCCSSPKPRWTSLIA